MHLMLQLVQAILFEIKALREQEVWISTCFNLSFSHVISSDSLKNTNRLVQHDK